MELINWKGNENCLYFPSSSLVSTKWQLFPRNFKEMIISQIIRYLQKKKGTYNYPEKKALQLSRLYISSTFLKQIKISLL